MKGTTNRIQAVDWLRGLVMVLMTVDHASAAFNAGRLFTDSARLYQRGTALDPAQFLTRWITHLCAPTFVLLAGVSLALSFDARGQGENSTAWDRFVLRRGLLIAVLEVWMSLGFQSGQLMLQVLYAIGLSMVCMVPLRRLRPGLLAGLALVFFVANDAVLYALRDHAGTVPLLGLLFSGFISDHLMIAFPVLPWLAIMMLGWVLGRWLLGGPERAPAKLVAAGTGALALFAVLRFVNNYGNAGLLRDDDSWVQWLHVSKYPPSLTFATLELGLALVLLGGFLAIERAGRGRLLRPLAVLGSAALAYYLLHVHLLEGTALLLGVRHKLGLAATYLSAAATLVVLYPVCLWWKRYRSAHPHGWARYI